MKIQVRANQMTHALSLLRRCIDPIPNMPFTPSSYLTILTEKSQVLLLASCGSFACRVEVPAQIEEAGGIAVSFEVFYQSVYCENHSSILTLEHENPGFCLVSLQNSTASIVARQEFPSDIIAMENVPVVFSCSEVQLKCVLDDVLPFIEKDVSGREWMRCISIESKNRDIEFVTAGFGHVVQAIIPVENELPGALVTHASPLFHLYRLLEGNDHAVVCYADHKEKKIYFRLMRHNMTMMVWMQNERFPNAHPAYSEDFDVEVFVNVKDAIQSLSRSYYYGKDTRLSITNEMMSVTSHTSGIGTYTTSFPCKVKKSLPQFTVLLPSRKLLSIFQHVKSERVLVKARVRNNQVLVFHPPDRHTKFFIFP